MLEERPHRREVTVKTAAETRKTFLRPNWSLILPASGIAMIWPS